MVIATASSGEPNCELRAVDDRHVGDKLRHVRGLDRIPKKNKAFTNLEVRVLLLDFEGHTLRLCDVLLELAPFRNHKRRP